MINDAVHVVVAKHDLVAANARALVILLPLRPHIHLHLFIATLIHTHTHLTYEIIAMNFSHNNVGHFICIRYLFLLRFLLSAAGSPRSSTVKEMLSLAECHTIYLSRSLSLLCAPNFDDPNSDSGF